MKDVLTQAPVLAYYDLSKDLTLQVDASKFGLGAVLFQEGRIVACASKSLTSSEINYAQIEKEMFAILFGCKRFHQYVYGRHITVESDHKPLESIVKKPLGQAPARLQRMMLQLQNYDMTVKHVPGKDIPVADTLSRKFMPDTFPNLSEGMDVQVHTVMSNLQFSSNKLDEIKRSTDSDPQLSTLRNVILQGWPELRNKCPTEILDFWTFRDELTVMDSIVFKGQRVVIPKSMRNAILEKIHSGHMGIEKSCQRARDILFWPKMTKDITDLVSNCHICLETRNSNPKEPLQSHQIPDRPWQVVASDLFTWDDHDFVLVVDYYSRFFEVGKLTSTRSSTVIAKLKGFFARHGIPEKLVSDNGPQYSAQGFSEFAEEWDFIHETSSPHFPQSNGLAEKTVQTIKHIFSKAKADNRDPYVGILEYRTSPLECGSSPSQLLMSRRLRSILPTTHQQLKPSIASHAQARVKMQVNRMRQKRYYDPGSKPLKPLHISETVRIRRKKLWEPAEVINQHDSRSYSVRTLDGAIYRRNRRHLLKTLEQTPLELKANLLIPDNLQVFPDKGNQENSYPVEPEMIPSTPPTEPTAQPIVTNCTNLQSDTNHYTTRSGRIVKPRIIPSM